LLAEVAGIFEGMSEGEPGEPRARQAAALCRKAGADPEAIPGVDRGGAAPESRRQAPAVLGATVPPARSVNGLAL
jgi:hypothetical protein